MRSSKPAGNGRAAWQWQVSPRETATRNGIDSGEQYLARVKEYTFETSAAGQIAARKAYPRNLLRVRISRASRTETRRTNAQVIAFRFASPTTPDQILSRIRATCTADHVPCPRAVGMPLALGPSAMALRLVAPPSSRLLIGGAISAALVTARCFRTAVERARISAVGRPLGYVGERAAQAAQ